MFNNPYYVADGWNEELDPEVITNLRQKEIRAECRVHESGQIPESEVFLMISGMIQVNKVNFGREKEKIL